MINSEIASIFYEMADILEMMDVQWKPRAYRQAARAIDSLPEDGSWAIKPEADSPAYSTADDSSSSASTS